MVESYNVGERIKGLRKKVGLTQKELSEILQVSQQTISLWESNATYPNAKDLILISKHFGVSADYLLGMDDDSDKHISFLLDFVDTLYEEINGLSDPNFMNCVYRFLNSNNEIIYIGKAKDLKNRLNNHAHLPKECYEEVCEVEYCSFETEDEMDLAERYLIPKIRPKYNSVMAGRKIGLSIPIFDNMAWIKYEVSKNHKGSRYTVVFDKLIEKIHSTVSQFKEN